MSTQSQRRLDDLACPACGQRGLETTTIVTDRGVRETVTCAACPWRGRPEREDRRQPRGPPEVEAVETWAVRWLRIATEQVLAPAVIALPGLWLVSLPAWRQAGLVYLGVAYLFVYQVGTWTTRL